jgi:parvulin-like peptidyl-prolyl isomerase
LFEDKVKEHFINNTSDYYAATIYEVIFNDRKLAMEYFLLIKEGETSFFEVAHKQIKDLELRRRCGFRGSLSKRQLKSEISASIFSVKPPCLLKPIKTSLGFHLIFVEEIIKPTLDSKLSSSIVSEMFLNWLEKELESIGILHED